MKAQTKKSAAAKRTTSAAQHAAGASARGAQKTAADGGDAQPQASAAVLIKKDHRTVEQLFAKYETLEDARQKQQLALQICTELINHTAIEEEIFYPACREKGIDTDMLDEAQVEHDAAKILINELMSGEADAEYYDAKVTVLREQIKHHVGEEEKPRSGILAKAAAAGVDMNELGRRIQARKQELASEGGRARAPRPVSLQLVLGNPPTEEESTMASQYGRERDERGGGSRYGRSRDDDYDDRGSRGGNRERDEMGRFTDDERSSRQGRSGGDDYDDRGNRSRGGGGRERDEYGRFASDDRGSSRSGGRMRDDEDDGRGHGRGGWFGDPEGHSQASREGWRGRDDDRRSSRSRDDDDDDRGGRSRGGDGGRERDEYGRFASDDRGSSRSGGRMRDDDDGRGHGRGGWFGDSRGHAEAAREGWRSRDDGGRSSRGRDDDDRGSRSSRSRDDDDDGRGHGRGGWFGDSRGHAEAAREGWRSRDDDRRSSRSSRDDDDDDGRGHGRGGWFGDSRGHAEAARQGWRNR
jgi:hypothetical protein